MARKKTPDVMGEVLGGKSQEEEEQAPDAATISLVDSSGEDTASRTDPLPRAEAGTGEKGTLASNTINKYAIWSMGVSLVPLPLVDIVAISGLQLKMLSVLSRLYGVDFSENAGRAIIASLLGSVGAHSLRQGTFSLVRSIPLVGWIAGWFVMPATAGALTYAVGKVFVQHYGSGGTFLNFDAAAFKASFKEQYDKGLEFVPRLKSGN